MNADTPTPIPDDDQTTPLTVFGIGMAVAIIAGLIQWILYP